MHRGVPFFLAGRTYADDKLGAWIETVGTLALRPPTCPPANQMAAPVCWGTFLVRWWDQVYASKGVAPLQPEY